MTLAEAVEVKPLYPSSTLLAIRDENPRLIQEALTRAKGKRESALYCIYVEEWPGLFAGATPHAPNEQGVETLKAALQAVRGNQIEMIPIWAVSHNAAEAIANAAKVARRRRRDHRRIAPFGVLPHAARPRGQRIDEETTAGLPLDDLQLISPQQMR